MIIHEFYIAIHQPREVRITCWNGVAGGPDELVFIRGDAYFPALRGFQLVDWQRGSVVIRNVSDHLHIKLQVENRDPDQNPLTGFAVSMLGANDIPCSGWFYPTATPSDLRKFRSDGSWVGSGGLSILPWGLQI